MSKEIVLPIKCSTVKRLHKCLWTVIRSLIYIASALSIGWSASVIARFIIAPYSYYPDYNGAACIIILALLTAIVWCIIAVIWVCDIILPRIPTITCIKDTEEE